MKTHAAKSAPMRRILPIQKPRWMTTEKTLFTEVSTSRSMKKTTSTKEMRKAAQLPAHAGVSPVGVALQRRSVTEPLVGDQSPSPQSETHTCMSTLLARRLSAMTTAATTVITYITFASLGGRTHLHAAALQVASVAQPAAQQPAASIVENTRRPSGEARSLGRGAPLFRGALFGFRYHTGCEEQTQLFFKGSKHP